MNLQTVINQRDTHWHRSCYKEGKMKTKEDRAMKAGMTITKRGAYIGAAAGLLVYAAVGLLPSSFIGGVLGLQIAGYLFSDAGSLSVVPRAVVGITMVLGVLVAGAVFVGGSTLLGWLCGYMGEAARGRRVHRLA
jgi:hypothetical protein